MYFVQLRIAPQNPKTPKRAINNLIVNTRFENECGQLHRQPKKQILASQVYQNQI